MSTLKENIRDPLQRFLDAQESMIEVALEELRAGRKQSHWMWFVFPQIAGLGQSEMARRFAIRDRNEAEAYLAHPELGPRLRECCEALLSNRAGAATDILGCPDDNKLRSCMTLFAAVAKDPALFERVLERFFGGHRDSRTLELLAD